jgi:hypothetical protein
VKSDVDLLNEAALDAARSSVFVTETVRCRPRTTAFEFEVEFPDIPLQGP